jgi:hypothetical protein
MVVIAPFQHLNYTFPILMKLGMIVMPLEATQTFFFFLVHAASSEVIAMARTCEVGTTLVPSNLYNVKQQNESCMISAFSFQFHRGN